MLLIKLQQCQLISRLTTKPSLKVTVVTLAQNTRQTTNYLVGCFKKIFVEIEVA